MERYSFSGKGNIIIKAKNEGKYGGKQYLANEPIAYFTNVFVNLNFQYIEKTPRVAIENLAVDPKSSPSYLRVSNIKVNESLQTLLYKKIQDQKKNRTKVERLESVDGSLLLSVQTGQTVNNELFIYDMNKNLITEYEKDADEITGLADGFYTIFYSINENASSIYSLDAPNYPNMTVEIEVLGNLNGVTGAAILHIDNVKLLTRPSLDMQSENPFVDDLDFAILSGAAAEVQYYG